MNHFSLSMCPQCRLYIVSGLFARQAQRHNPVCQLGEPSVHKRYIIERERNQEIFLCQQERFQKRMGIRFTY